MLGKPSLPLISTVETCHDMICMRLACNVNTVRVSSRSLATGMTETLGLCNTTDRWKDIECLAYMRSRNKLPPTSISIYLSSISCALLCSKSQDKSNWINSIIQNSKLSKTKSTRSQTKSQRQRNFQCPALALPMAMPMAMAMPIGN